MSKLFKRHTGIHCFFCQSLVPSPQNLRSFQCPSCSCWNRYDINGEIMSDEPAMHDESMNARSFAKRASSTTDRFPTTYGRSPFCHNCQTNQMLLMNLLSTYLPSPNSPEYARRLELLPNYKESLESRYPPICETCLPAVEEEIHKKDQMARAKALGGWLKESKGKDQRRRVSATRNDQRKASLKALLWTIRGCLWGLCYAMSLLGNALAAYGYAALPALGLWLHVFPIFVLVSILWTAWDPTYLSYQKARAQGRDVRQRGKGKYVMLQLTVWMLRLFTAALLVWNPSNLLPLHDLSSRRSRKYYAVSSAVEFISFVMSWVVLQLQYPPTIRLIDTSGRTSRAPTPMPSADTKSQPIAGGTQSSLGSKPPLLSSDALAALTLSSQPIFTTPQQSQAPLFGVSSFPASTAPKDRIRHRSGDADEMDWTPTGGPGDVMMDDDDMADADMTSANSKTDFSSWLRPQRFFAPEKPTGLEGLLERTSLVDEREFGGPAVGKFSLVWAFMRSPSTMFICGLGAVIIGLGYGMGFKLTRSLS